MIECFCDISEGLKAAWRNDEFLNQAVADVFCGRQFDIPSGPFVTIEEFDGQPNGCNHDVDYWSVPIIMTVRCIHKKSVASQIRTAVKDAFESLQFQLECHTMYGLTMSRFPAIQEINKEYQIRFQFTAKVYS